MMFWEPKTRVLGCWKQGCIRRLKAAYTTLPPRIRMLSKNPNFNYIVGPNSKSHSSLNINPNYVKLMSKLRTRISIFQWNKLHSKIIRDAKVMIKIVSKCHFSTSFSKQFEHFWVVITFELSRSITLYRHIKLIIGPRAKGY